jgi:phosphoribosylformylglycinamidine synthase
VIKERDDYTDDLVKLLASWNICSKEPILRQYDHEVQALSAVKPFVGVAADGPGDATVLTPLLGVPRFAAVASGLCPAYSDIDPYWMAAAAIDEALRNVIAVGASLERCALLDNFCWGDCAKPDRLGGLVRAARACHDFAVAFGTPFVSGKDSLNNEFAAGGETVAIPGTLLVSALALLPEGTRPVTMDAKAAGNRIYMVGWTREELGGSRFLALRKEIGRAVPKTVATESLAVFGGLSRAAREGTVRSMHDCSEGGFAVALAEMAFAGGLGATAELDALPAPAGAAASTAARLFGESTGRLLAEVEPAKAPAFEAALQDAGAPFAAVGTFAADGQVTILKDHKPIVRADAGALKTAWQKPMAELWG